MAVRLFGAATAVAAMTGAVAGLAHADVLPKLAGDKPVTVYLHRGGVELQGGHDNPDRGHSDLVEAAGYDSVSIPAFTGDDAAWQEFVGCVDGQFADFNIEIVDERPASGDYIMVAVGGSPDLLGRDSTVRGLAPFNGRVLHDAVAFVFEPDNATPRSLCETTAEEVGHALGLDHSRLCNDVMSYGDCGPKVFVDEHAPCGEWDDRTCSNRQPTQNSHQLLAQRVGYSDGSRPPVLLATPGLPMLSLSSEQPRRVVACDGHDHGHGHAHAH